MPFWRFAISQEALPKVREWSGGPPKGPGVVGRSSRWSGCGREALSEGPDALPKVREWLGGPQGGP